MAYKNEKYTKRWRKRHPWHYTYVNIKYRCSKPRRYQLEGVYCLITPEELKSLWFRDNASYMKSPSIDRIDSNGSYTLDNCRFTEMSFNRSRFHIAKTHCKYGHYYGADNTILKKSGSRMCRICHNDRRRKKYAERRALESR